ncbi:MAG: serine/threonine protein phosphatase [Desulfobulbus sp.]|nr:serine/threonine protein phosphatase [Desulfobulbus sp.]
MSAIDSTTCVIGDIHGCHESLVHLLSKIVHRADTIVFLGDYVDRGPHSKEVVTTILSLTKSHPRVIPLMGNHDFLFLKYLNGEESSLFLQVGGKQTLISYGLSIDASTEEIHQRVPPEHITFFRNLPLYWENQHAIYVHAGLMPGCHLSQQTAQWCLWARESFLSSTADFGKPVIFGHTVFPDPLITVDKIGIDTGAVYGGELTALLLPEQEFISVPGLHTSYQ